MPCAGRHIALCPPRACSLRAQGTRLVAHACFRAHWSTPRRALHRCAQRWVQPPSCRNSSSASQMQSCTSGVVAGTTTHRCSACRMRRRTTSAWESERERERMVMLDPLGSVGPVAHTQAVLPASVPQRVQVGRASFALHDTSHERLAYGCEGLVKVYAHLFQRNPASAVAPAPPEHASQSPERALGAAFTARRCQDTSRYAKAPQAAQLTSTTAMAGQFGRSMDSPLVALAWAHHAGMPIAAAAA